ncbi:MULTISPECIES: tape measure protein [Sphingomonadales]|uniref:tape measure protein n=2 Tax=Alphaproteobacteria TaxID=28211 RepID=UPI00082544F7|nr:MULTISPECIES: tape measure protein [Sphingomonadales]
MATEIDPVILVLEARLDKYEAGLRNAVRTSDQSFGRIDRDVRRLEQQFSRSSAAIGGSLRGLAGTFAAAVTTQQVTGLIDSYTRLQNSLKVAGVEGESLAQVQSRLLDLSGRYGVNIEELARLFGNSSQAASDLGASQDQLLTLTEATAQALKITGTSAAQAQGAILGLTQALASGTVRAEEFNQINEGGLRPLLQLVANTERYGGSVAQLRNAVVEGKVSSQEFYQAILAGSEVLGGQASKATLTIAGAFESLNSQLTVYVGQAAEANGASAAIAGGLQLLANNLDVVIPAIAVLASTIAVQFVAANVAAQAALGGTAASMGVVGAASFALQARLLGAATGMEAAAFAARGLQAALLGPVGIGLAVTAVALGLSYLATRTQEAAQASQTYAKIQNEAKLQTDRAADAADRLATAHGKARAQALAQAQAERENTKQKLISAQASLILAQAEASRAREFAKRTRASGGLAAADPRVAQAGGRRLADAAAASSATAEANIKAAEDSVRSLQASLDRIDAAIKSVPGVANVPAVNTRRLGGGGSATGGGPVDVAGAGRAGRDVGGAIAEALRRLDQFTRNQFDLASAGNQNEQDLLRSGLRIVRTREERTAIEKRLIALQFSQERAEQELVLNTLDSTKTAKDIARARLAVLDALQKQADKEAEIANESPGQRFLREVSLTGEEINDEVELVATRGLQNLNDQLVDAIFNAESLGDVFSNVAKSIVADLLRIAIQQAVIRPLAENLFGGGGGGGGIFSAIGSLLNFAPGRASGGPVSAGRLYRVNEAAGAGGVELFQPAQNGNIVPLGQTRAAMGGGQQSISGTITISLSEDIDGRIVSVAGPLSVQIVREASGPLIEASANEALRRAGRPKL